MAGGPGRIQGAVAWLQGATDGRGSVQNEERCEDSSGCDDFDHGDRRDGPRRWPRERVNVRAP